MRNLMLAAASLQEALRAANEIRFERSPSVNVANDRVSGGEPHSDPTFDITADELRLGVSDACRRAERAISDAEAAFLKARTALVQAVDTWHGTNDRPVTVQ